MKAQISKGKNYLDKKSIEHYQWANSEGEWEGGRWRKRNKEWKGRERVQKKDLKEPLLLLGVSLCGVLEKSEFNW